MLQCVSTHTSTGRSNKELGVKSWSEIWGSSPLVREGHMFPPSCFSIVQLPYKGCLHQAPNPISVLLSTLTKLMPAIRGHSQGLSAARLEEHKRHIAVTSRTRLSLVHMWRHSINVARTHEPLENPSYLDGANLHETALMAQGQIHPRMPSTSLPVTPSWDGSSRGSISRSVSLVARIEGSSEAREVTIQQRQHSLALMQQPRRDIMLSAGKVLRSSRMLYNLLGRVFDVRCFNDFDQSSK